MFNLFKTAKSHPANSSKHDVALASRKKNPSKKKKSTMEVRFSPLFNASLFQACDSIPLPVVKRNAIQVQNETGFMSCTDFPNPGAYNMAAEYKYLAPVMGNLACTITQYYDKETGKPVLMLFPTLDVYVYDGYEKNYMERLNHASRRDFEYQLNKIRDLRNNAMTMQKKTR